jgi:hypothetical protein
VRASLQQVAPYQRQKQNHRPHPLLHLLNAFQDLKLGQRETVNKVSEGSPHIVDMIKNDQIDLIINSTEDTQGAEDAAEIRRCNFFNNTRAFNILQM